MLNEYKINWIYLNKYNRLNLIGDSTIIDGSDINSKLGWEDSKAIYFKLLSENINCCFSSEAGTVKVERITGNILTP